jgi:hypothetical protein
LAPGWEWRSADFSEEDGVVHRLGLDRLFVALKPDEVRALLLRLADDLATDLTAARVEGFCAELLDDDSEDDPLLEAEAELMVLGPPPVVEQVQRQIESFCASASLRLIPAT